MTSPVALDVATAMDKKPGDVVAGETPPCLPATPAVPPSKPTKLTPLPLLRPQRMNTAEVRASGPNQPLRVCVYVYVCVCVCVCVCLCVYVSMCVLHLSHLKQEVNAQTQKQVEKKFDKK